MRVVNPQLRPELRKEGAGAAVPDPCKTRVSGCLDEVATQQRVRENLVDAGVTAPHLQSLSDDTRARLAEGRGRLEQAIAEASALAADGRDPLYEQVVRGEVGEAYSQGGETFSLVVEVRLTKHSIGGSRGRRIAAGIVQALLDKAVADHAINMHAQGQQPRVAGFTVRLS